MISVDQTISSRTVVLKPGIRTPVGSHEINTGVLNQKIDELI